MPTTIHQVWETCDNKIARAANAILGKLQFYVIISSAIDPKLKRSPIRIVGRSLQLLITAEKW